MYKLGLEKAEESEIKLPTFLGSQRKQGNSKKKICFIDYAKALTVWITRNCGKFLKRWEYQTTLPPEYPACISKATLRTRHGKIASKSQKEYVKLYIVTLLI